MYEAAAAAASAHGAEAASNMGADGGEYAQANTASGDDDAIDAEYEVKN